MPMPKPVCRTNLYNKIIQLEVCRTFSGRGMGINGTAQSYCYLQHFALSHTLTKKSYSAQRTTNLHYTYIYIYIYIYTFKVLRSSAPDLAGSSF